MVYSAAAIRVMSEIDTHGEMTGEMTGEPNGEKLRSEEAPAIDLVHLSRQTFGDHELERELLALFARQATQFAARLAAPISPAASVGRAEIVHTLKGSARAIGAFGVAAAAESYEQTLRRGESVAAAGARLEAAIDAARAAVNTLLGA